MTTDLPVPGRLAAVGLDPRQEHDLVAQVVDYAILGLDTDGRIATWNAGAVALKGYSSDEAVGRHFSVFYTEEDRASGLPDRLLARAREAGRVEDTGWRVRQDGSRFWADVVITALHDDQGSLTGYAKVTRDLTEQHTTQAALAASEARFRLLVSQVVDYAILGLDADGRIATWNAGAAVVKGYSAEEAVGRHFSVFYTEEDRASGLPDRLLARAREAGRVEDTGWRVRQDGSRFWADVVITALHDDQGSLTGYAKVTRDLTEQHRLDQSRRSFLAGISHDFRTPLTAIRGFASVLAADDDGGRRGRDLATRIVSNADRLTAMVDQLVEHAELRAGAVRLHPVPVDVCVLARELVADLAGGALAARDVHVTAGECWALADPTAVRRVLQNLLSNAGKYSPSDSSVEVDVRPVGEDRVLVSVADRGRGIDPADAEVVLREYERGRRAETDGGFGLGLAVVAELVSLHGGSVRLRPRDGGGTVVEVDLPAAPAP